MQFNLIVKLDLYTFKIVTRRHTRFALKKIRQIVGRRKIHSRGKILHAFSVAKLLHYMLASEVIEILHNTATGIYPENLLDLAG